MKKDYPDHSFSYIQNGVDTEKYKKVSKNEKLELRKKYNLDINKIIYISTGSFIPRKRIEETIKGFLKANIKESILLLLGDGILFKALYSKYAMHKNIIFYGKTNKVEEFLQLSDVFISSSESEGLPNSVIEAISCGLPVILSNIPQHKEILDELKELGKVYELGNIDELTKLIQNKKGIISKSTIENSLFTMKNMSNKYVEYYERILENE